MVSCLVAAILEFPLLLEQEALNFHFVPGPANEVASPAPAFLDSATSAHEALGPGASRLVLGALSLFSCSLSVLDTKSVTPSLSSPNLSAWRISAHP